MTVILNDSRFMKDLNNFIQYSEGFIEGIQLGKKNFLIGVSKTVVENLKDFIDSNARIDPETLQHVYEWYQSGIASARLFEINPVVNSSGIRFTYEFKQSDTIKDGSNVPFYNKAEIMERGMAVTIRPVNAKVLNFDVDGEEVFVKGSITVNDPGGPMAKDGFKETIDTFFNSYFTQSFLESSGIMQRLKDLRVFKDGISYGKIGSRSVGKAIGYKWISESGGAQ